MTKPISAHEAAMLYGNRFLTEDAPDGPFPTNGMSALDAHAPGRRGTGAGG